MAKIRSFLLCGIFLSYLACVFISAVRAQSSGGAYVVSRSVIASGGTTMNGATNYSITGTDGQCTAGGPFANTPYELFSGFWTFDTSGTTPTPTPGSTPTPTPTGTPMPTSTPTPTPSPMVSGRVLYENVPRPVPNVTLNVSGAPSSSSSTDANGDYSLTLTGTAEHTVTPSRPGKTCNDADGILANDASLIAQHVVGLTTLNMTQRRAADVAGLGPDNISSFEAALIARWIVCLNDVSNQTGQWKFTPASRTYSNLTSDRTGEDYGALLLGDVSGDWTDNLVLAPERPAATFTSPKVSLPRITARRNTSVTVPLSIRDLMGRGLTAYQFDIEYDPSVVTPAEIAADVDGTLSEGLAILSNSPEPGLLKVAVYGAAPATVDGVHVNLHFTIIAQARSATPLVLRNFRMNDGTLPVLASSGSIEVLLRGGVDRF